MWLEVALPPEVVLLLAGRLDSEPALLVDDELGTLTGCDAVEVEVEVAELTGDEGLDTDSLVTGSEGDDACTALTWRTG